VLRLSILQLKVLPAPPCRLDRYHWFRSFGIDTHV